ncbi:hypothetical protein BX600DRAFT_447842 [Xylariales sp. PMI_506]|nr:hypothetical protein BX600DRAFT_447842 [Xylariales sp. PMI_506]
MAEDNDHPTLAPSNPKRHSRTSTVKSGRSHNSYDVGEMSMTPSQPRDSFSTGGSTLDPSFHTERTAHETRGSSRSRVANGEYEEDSRRRIRSHRPRPSGGFLLSSTISDEQATRLVKNPARTDGRRRSRIPIESSRNRKSESPVSRPEEASSPVIPSSPVLSGDLRRQNEMAGSKSLGANARPSSASRIPSPRPSTALDADSTQIVSMALNLSESRRMAQRRNISTPMPPRLAQLPDSPAGGGLKQHLQQQRRTSRNISPLPERSSLTPKSIPVLQQKLSSPLQTSFDPDSGYTYHFSSSTLNRAQKAREQLDLMAQYRRLLQFVPRLDYTGQIGSRPSTSSPPTSPGAGPGSTNPLHATLVPLGREYNPLQYIRNRKVRARERMAIDGNAQGFGDVNKVTDWVDRAATLAATSPIPGEAPAVPFFPGARNPMNQPDPHSSIPVPVVNATKAKLPRIDWVIEPADMLADIYWVEQDDNRSRIEDRHYTRMFPRSSITPSRPMSQEANEPVKNNIMGSLEATQETQGAEVSPEGKLSDGIAISRADTGGSHASARERARQKLHEFKGIHHRHNSSVHSHHDFLHLRKTSFSDTSDSDLDRRKRQRSGTVGADGQALLEKQMGEMLAKEAIEEEEARTPGGQEDHNPDSFRPTLMTPDSSVEPSVRGHSPRDSRVEEPDLVERMNNGLLGHGSPIRSGRASLEVPGWNARVSMDLDTSLPSSPDLGATKRGRQYLPAIGMDLSPPVSRPGSPSRNPFSKVKHMFRDRSKDRGGSHTHGHKDEAPDSPVEQIEHLALLPVGAEILGPPEHRPFKSPVPLAEVSRADTHKSHKSVGSLRLGRDEQIGLKNILKGGAKIDDIIRGSVNKVSDLLWKKDHGGDDDSSETSTDESDSEPSRGRPRTPAVLSRASSKRPTDRQPKHYLDVMPSFKSASEADKTAFPSDGAISATVPTQDTPSRRSTRFDKLKPPRLDVESASPAGSPVELRGSTNIDEGTPDISLPSRRGSGISANGARKSSAQLNAILSIPQPPSSRPPVGMLSNPRHWSISNGPSSPKHAAHLSKRELARLRVITLSSGIKAMEISRRAMEPVALSIRDITTAAVPWAELSQFACPSEASLAVSQVNIAPTTARILQASITNSNNELDVMAQNFVENDMRNLRARVDSLHTRVASELIDMTRRAADEADECSRDLVDSQRLKVKRLVDMIDKMIRRRRRRFRWARRGGWLMVEWALVGFMWYVWFLVMIARVFLGIGKGLVSVGRWLLWL